MKDIQHAAIPKRQILDALRIDSLAHPGRPRVDERFGPGHIDSSLIEPSSSVAFHSSVCPVVRLNPPCT